MRFCIEGSRSRRTYDLQMAKAGTRGSRRQADADATSGDAAAAADRAAARAERAAARGARLNSAQTKLRDAVIIARHAQRASWGDIAREVGISARQCQRVVEAAQAVPSPIEETPMALLETLARDFARSIATYESMAFAWADTNQAAALGARKAADDTRGRLAQLLQDVGKLPSNLELFRSEMEMMRIAEEMGNVLAGVRDGEKSPEEAIEFFRALIVNRGRAQLVEKTG